jgi:serine/threonine protein kinase
MLPGNTFASRYRLQKKVGVRAYAEVWQAIEETAVDAVVALKIFAPERGIDDTTLKLFYREYAELLSLSHPNLLAVRHFDVWQGYPYLVMSYCHGGSLYQKLLDEGPLTESEIARLLMQIGNSLEFLHEKNILHRDIKPDNILIDKQGNYLLSDFGISTQLRHVLRKSSATDKVLSIAYAPPERFGSVQESRKEGDVFALGVLLYEVCTGELPWMGAGGVVLREDSILPQLPPTYSRALQSIVQHCLQYDQFARPSAANLRAAATSFVQHGQWPTPYFQQNDQPQKIVSAVAPVVLPGWGDSNNTPFESGADEEEEMPGDQERMAEMEMPQNERLPEQESLVEEIPEISPDENASNEQVIETPPLEEIEEIAELPKADIEIAADEPEVVALAAEPVEAVIPDMPKVIMPADEPVAISEETGQESEEVSAKVDHISNSEFPPHQVPESRKKKNPLLVTTVLIVFILLAVTIYVLSGTRARPLDVMRENSENNMTRYNALLEQGRSAFQAGDFVLANTLARDAASWCSDCSAAQQLERTSADSIAARFTQWIASGDQFAASGKYDDAEQAYREASVWQPDSDLPAKRLAALTDQRSALWSRGKLSGLTGMTGELFDYEGQLLNGLPHGKGMARYHSGILYTGDFLNGRMAGNGKLSFPDGTVYSGRFLNNQYHGEGVLIYANGDTYVGTFHNGASTGLGSFIPAR